jgi:hypothetical protein
MRLIGIDFPVAYPFHNNVWPNDFGIHEQSLLPRVRALVFRWEGRATRYLIGRWPFRHYLLLLASGFVAFLVLRQRTDRNRYLVYLLFVGGLSVLFPLCIVTPTPDWRYMMAASVCWVCSLLIALAGRLSARWSDSVASDSVALNSVVSLAEA